jgi:hypothetical protein
MKLIRNTAAIFILCTISSHALAFLPQANPVPGGIAVVPLVKSATEVPTAYFGQQRLLVIIEDNIWYAIVGLGLTQVPGQYIVKFSAPSLRETTRSFNVNTGTFGIYGHRELQPEQDATEVDADGNPGTELFQRLANQWSETESIDLPLQNPVADIEATLGTDDGYFSLVYHTPAGTEVHAPAAGRVITTQDQEHTGLTLAIDHGQGLFSMLGYLDQVLAKTDEMVAKSQTIALSGNDGSTQLSWVVLLNGNVINPLSLTTSIKPSH